MSKSKAVVLFSGGQDSTTCLYWAKESFDEVHALSIVYGQRHDVEIEAAKKIAEIAGVSHEVVTLPRVLVGTSPLVSDVELGQYDTIDELPDGIEPTFVPGRNALFLVIAANRAAAIGATEIVTGVCEEDYGGYPDCRRSFIDSMELSLSRGFAGEEQKFTILTPLMHLTKKETVDMAIDRDGCMDALAYSHTCYNGQVPPCGKCHACHLRARGFEEADVTDPLIDRVGSA